MKNLCNSSLVFFLVISLYSVHSGPLEDTEKEAESPEVRDYISSCLAIINGYRAKHGSPPCSNGLAGAAASCAKRYAGGAAVHSCPEAKGLGENVATSSGGGMTVEKLCPIGVHGWYAENRAYNYNNPNVNAWQSTGHFTYMIWKSSTTCGLGCAAGSTIRCVALFSPKGNTPTVAAYKANVGPPRKEEEEGEKQELENQLALIQKFNVTLD